jgi:hypothetical protein
MGRGEEEGKVRQGAKKEAEKLDGNSSNKKSLGIFKLLVGLLQRCFTGEGREGGLWL